MDGVSLAYTFDDPDAPGRKTVQYFENNASRGIYRDGWYACAFGPFVPWDTPSTAKRLEEWDINTEPWELYHLDEDFSQANDLADNAPRQARRTEGAVQGGVARQPGLAGGRGLWTRIHPEDRIASPYTSGASTKPAAGCRNSTPRPRDARTATSRSR